MVREKLAKKLRNYQETEIQENIGDPRQLLVVIRTAVKFANRHFSHYDWPASLSRPAIMPCQFSHKRCAYMYNTFVLHSALHAVLIRAVVSDKIP